MTGVLVTLLWTQNALAATVLIVGDSISAAFGLETSQGWVHLLQNRLAERGEPHQVVNASVSGDTTSGGLARLPSLLSTHRPSVVILELGGNDGLRGQSPTLMKQNLASMIDLSRAAGADVLLLGMRMPPNLGARYISAYAQAFDALAQEKAVAYVPFFLDGVGGSSELMQADRIHPTAQAQERLLNNAWPQLEGLL